MSRLRSSPQGSVLGALNALFSPHPVTGAPSASQAAQQGLLGKIISQPGGGGQAGPSGGQGTVSQVLGGNTGAAQGNANQRVSAVGLPQDTTTTDKVKVVGAPSDNAITTTDRVNTVGLPTSGGTITTQDRVNVTGLPTSGGTVTTQVKEQLDQASAAKTESDAKASGDRSGTGWAASFASHIRNLLPSSATSAAEKGAKDSGNRAGANLGSGLLGGIGPGILGVSAKVSGIVGGVGSVLGTLPALAGVAGVGTGVALIGGIVGVVSKGAISAVQPAVQAFQKLQDAAPGKAQVAALAAYRQQLDLLTPAQKSLASSLEGAQSAWQKFVTSNTAGVATIIGGGIGLLPGILSQVSGVFQAVVPQMASVWKSLGGVIQGVLGVARTAVPAFAPFVNAVLGLVSNVLPGISTVIKATLPFISQFAGILGTLGRDLGSLFSVAAPAIGASMTILGGLLGLLGDLLPAVMKIADIFAKALAPVFVAFTGVIRTLIPPLVQAGAVIASFAGAVIGDLAAAFKAVAVLIGALAPSLTVLATTFTSVFTVLENTGVFAVFGDALENLALPVAKLVNALVTGLAPALPVLVGAAAQLSAVLVGALSAALGAVLAAAVPVVTVFAKAVTAVVDFLQNTGLLLPVMAALALRFGPVASGLVAMGKGLALFASGSFVSAIAGIVTGIRDFIVATEGATLAEKALLASEVALDAVSPLVWVGLALAPLALLTGALVKYSAQSQTVIGEFQQQQQQLSYNIAGYQKLAAQLDTASQGFEHFAQTNSDAVRGGAAAMDYLSKQAAAMSVQVSAAAAAMGQRLTALSTGLGVSKTVIEQWASAAGISATKFAGAGENVGLLTTQIVGFVNKNAEAVTSTASLSTNIAIFGNDVFSATAQLDAFNAIWNTLVGGLLSKQQAITTSQSQFDSLSQTIKSSGANSDSANQSFQQYIAQIGASASTLEKQGASVSTVNGYLQTQIANIESLGPLNKGQEADLQALKAFQDDLANSTNGLNAQQKTLISQFEGSLIPDLQKMGADTPPVNTAISNLANSIIQTGNSSSSTAGDRAALIKDLENAGLSASGAKGFVDTLQGSIDNLKGKVVSVGVVGSGSGTITFAEQNIKNAQTGLLEFHAAGGLIKGGVPGKDSVLGMLMPGEVVVPAPMVAGGAVDHLRGQLPGFAAGGLVGPYGILSGAGQDFMGTAMTQAGQAVEAAAAQAMIADMQAKVAAAAAAAAVPTVATAGSSGGVIATAMRNMAAARGWTGAEWNALYAVEMAEAGFNMTATNPTSGAYGLAQFINGPSEYASYGGNSTTATGQITGMLNYIAQRYGDPIAAEAHEQAYHWYGDGGVISEPVLGRGMRSGDRYVLGERGSEMVTPIGGARGGKSVDDLADRLDQLHADMREMVAATRQVPAGVGAHVGGVINGAAHDASFYSRYPRGGG